jgi:hypothetical protein
LPRFARVFFTKEDEVFFSGVALFGESCFCWLLLDLLRVWIVMGRKNARYAAVTSGGLEKDWQVEKSIKSRSDALINDTDRR